MGSSRKHKERNKDKDRDEKKSRHKTREHRDKEKRHRKHKKRDKDKDEGERKRRKKNDSLSENLLEGDNHKEENPILIPDSPPKSAGTASGGYQESLSIEETNKIRIKLGLKPLKERDNVTKDGAKVDKDVSYTERPDVHKPATNLAQKKKTETIKEKLALIKEKRRLNQKLKKVKTIADDYDDFDLDNTSEWIQKSRKISAEKEKAEKQAKMLQEMDEEFGISDLVQDEFKKEKETVYSARDVAGLRVEHAQKSFKEGQRVILTLKDSQILGEDADVLVNYNFMDDEKAAKNVELRKKRPGYVAYENEEEDDYGFMKPKAMLSKYDEEIDGERRKFFRLDTGGSVAAEDLTPQERIRLQLKSQAVSLEMKAPTLASEYYTSAEMESFKKPRTKKKRKLKKKSIVEELLAMQAQNKKMEEQKKKIKEKEARMANIEEGEIDEDVSKVDDASNRRVEDMNLDSPDEKDEKEAPGQDEDEDEDWGPPIEDEAEKELQNVLNKARKLKQKKNRKKNPVGEQVAEVVLNIKIEPEEPQLIGFSQNASTVVLHSTSEFCRALGDIPTYGMSGNRQEEEDEELMDYDKDAADTSHVTEDDVQGWARVNPEEEDEEKDEELKPVLEEEPDIRGGCGGALMLAVQKGYLEQETMKGQNRSKGGLMSAQNFTIEDKNYNDIDAKYNKHERGYRGPLQDFKEKEGYKPNVKISYVDETGRSLNRKEAFRVLSHRFHGKGSGKLKTEKRLKKIQEEQAMMKMSSTDTPLHTVARMQEKQRQMQSPYIVLTGGGKNLATNPITK